MTSVVSVCGFTSVARSFVEKYGGSTEIVGFPGERLRPFHPTSLFNMSSILCALNPPFSPSLLEVCWSQRATVGLPMAEFQGVELSDAIIEVVFGRSVSGPAIAACPTEVGNLELEVSYRSRGSIQRSKSGFGDGV